MAEQRGRGRPQTTAAPEGCIATVAAAAKYANVHPTTIHRWMRLGDLMYKVDWYRNDKGTITYIRIAALERMVRVSKPHKERIRRKTEREFQGIIVEGSPAADILGSDESMDVDDYFERVRAERAEQQRLSNRREFDATLAKTVPGIVVTHEEVAAKIAADSARRKPRKPREPKPKNPTVPKKKYEQKPWTERKWKYEEQ